ncbi:MAG: hAT family dimerization domain-containing protein [Candidatus Saccharimonadales bacterium]
MDPRYRKLEFLEMYPVAQMIAKGALKSAFNALLEEKKQLEEDALPEQPPAKRARGEDDLEAEAGMVKHKKALSEYDKWTTGEDEPPTTDVLTWWKNHEADFPILAILARRYLAIPASSASSERVFSRLKNIVTPKRERMSSKTLCQLLFVKHHLDTLR